MTHSLHRLGEIESLKQDFVVLSMPSTGIDGTGINVEGSGPKLKRFLEICRANNCVTFGDCKKGNAFVQGGDERVLKNIVDHAVPTASFKDKEDVINVLRDLKKEDSGLSVVVSGLEEEVRDACKKANLEVHTIEHSLGRWGKTELLPDRKVLEISLMCGHAQVPVNLIYELVEEVEKGKMTAEEAAEELFKPCMCGIFNTDRATKLINEYIAQKK